MGLPFRGRIAEDFVSTRWFEEKFRQITGVAITGVKPMIDYYHADKYTAEVRAIFDEFARTFAEIMLPFVQRFGADTLVVGGGMVRAEEFSSRSCASAFEQKGVQIPVVAMADTTTAIIAGAAALCEITAPGKFPVTVRITSGGMVMVPVAAPNPWIAVPDPGSRVQLLIPLPIAIPPRGSGKYPDRQMQKQKDIQR
ncbi:MAG: hypothetical protein ACLR8Y_07515 [Alistipes indistinctus]